MRCARQAINAAFYTHQQTMVGTAGDLAFWFCGMPRKCLFFPRSARDGDGAAYGWYNAERRVIAHRVNGASAVNVAASSASIIIKGIR